MLSPKDMIGSTTSRAGKNTFIQVINEPPRNSLINIWSKAALTILLAGLVLQANIILSQAWVPSSVHEILDQRQQDIGLTDEEFEAYRATSDFQSPGVTRTRVDDKPYVAYNTVDETMSGSKNPALGLGGGKGAKIDGPSGMETSEVATTASSDTTVATGAMKGPTTIPSLPPVTEFQKRGQVCRHKRIITTYIHNFKFINAQNPYKSDYTGSQFYLVTPFAYVPVDIIGFYFTRNELSQLPMTAEATNFKTMIRPIGFRLPFQTQASGTTYANSMTDIIGMYAFGLNNTFNGRNMKPTYSTTNPTDVASVDITAPINQEYFPSVWKTDEVSDVTKKKVSSMAGNVTPLTSFFIASGPLEADAAAEPLLMDHITTFDMMNKGNVVVG